MALCLAVCTIQARGHVRNTGDRPMLGRNGKGFLGALLGEVEVA